MNITFDVRPRLSRTARLRLDATQGAFLLAPERGLRLNPTATAIVQRCDGTLTVGQIVRELRATFFEAAGPIENDVLRLLNALHRRRWIDF